MKRPVRSPFQIARQVAQSVVPRKSYTLLANAINWSYAVRRLGLKQSLRLWHMRLPDMSYREKALVEVTAPNLAYPLYVRPGTSDVRGVLYTVARETYAEYLPKGEVKYILDAGANLGDTAAWFLTRFPEAQVVAVEPDPENFAILRRNAAPYGNRLHPVLAAVWPESAQLSLQGDGVKDAVEVVASTTGDCAGLTIPQLMEQFGIPRLDILKIDIESAELALFSIDSDPWLSRTQFIVIEIHGPECQKAVVDATSRHGFTHRIFRDLHIFERPGQEAIQSIG